MILVTNWKYHLGLFLNKKSLEIMSDDHLVIKRPPTLPKYGFHVVTILDLKWLVF